MATKTTSPALDSQNAAVNVDVDTGEISPIEYFLDHKGNLKMVAQMCAIEHIPGRGVIVLKADSRPYYWYEQGNNDIAIRVRNKLVEMVMTKGHCTPLDWPTLLQG